MSLPFTLDTSGAVVRYHSPGVSLTRWSDLSPFEQGYAEAALRDPVDVSANLDHGAQSGVLCGFRHLAPETLETIRADCAAYLAWPWRIAGEGETLPLPTIENGRLFWEARQGGHDDDFPPFTLTLGDDGKVRSQ